MESNNNDAINARKREKYKLNPEDKRAKNRAWYQANKERKLSVAATWERNNRTARSKQRRARRELLAGTPEFRWSRLVQSARVRKNTAIEFTKEEFVLWASTNATCVYCKSGNTRQGSFVDRIDPKQPYRLSNIAACCKVCNVAKNNLPLEVFKEHVKAMYIALFKKTPPVG